MPAEPVRFNVDKRTSRKENAEDFIAGMDQFRETLRQNAEVISGEPLPSSSFTVYVRARPLFQHEVEKGEYETITCVGEQAIVGHKCNMRPDLKHMFITHRRHRVHCVFDCETGNAEVYGVVGAPLMRAMMDGHNATLLVFGQTGSGKTYTMTGIYEHLAQDVFRFLPKGSSLLLSSFELAGAGCTDLLNGHAPLVLREDASGELNLVGLTQVPINNGRDLLQWIQRAQEERTSHATTINAQSSRSHCFIKLTVGSAAGGATGPMPKSASKAHLSRGGSLTFVDLAGSERNEDSFNHDAERRKEGAFINASLAVLKQCIRLQTSSADSGVSHIPYRQSELTRLLKDAFVNPTAVSAVIATVSPCATDTEHSLDTLHHATLMASSETHTKNLDQDVPLGLANYLQCGEYNLEKRAIPPVRWTCEEVQGWLEQISEGQAWMPAGIDGQQLVRMSKQRFIQACNGNKELGAVVFDALQAEVKNCNQQKVASAKASRNAQQEHKQVSAMQKARMYKPAPLCPRI